MFLFRYFDTDFIREALKSRLSLGMTSNKTYHFQTTANHHRFIKVWTSIADLPTSKFVVQTFFLEKVWLRNTLPTYDLDICPNFRSFFFGSLSLALFCISSLPPPNPTCVSRLQAAAQPCFQPQPHLAEYDWLYRVSQNIELTFL